jgi:phosphoribosylanthranilate isomerase
MAIRYGASALGLVGAMPSGPGVISDELIREIAGIIPPPIASFLLTSETDAEKIIAHHRNVQTNTVQIVDELQSGSYQQLRQAMPGVKLVQVIHVIDEESVVEAVRISAQVDALLLDSGNPNAAIKTLGGTGNTHDWKLSRAIREQSKVPVFLAGGLKASNVGAAIKEVQPYGLDLCSGVRTDGKLDEGKLKAFFEAVRASLHGQ